VQRLHRHCQTCLRIDCQTCLLIDCQLSDLPSQRLSTVRLAFADTVNCQTCLRRHCQLQTCLRRDCQVGFCQSSIVIARVPIDTVRVIIHSQNSSLDKIITQSSLVPLTQPRSSSEHPVLIRPPHTGQNPNHPKIIQSLLWPGRAAFISLLSLRERVGPFCVRREQERLPAGRYVCVCLCGRVCVCLMSVLCACLCVCTCVPNKPSNPYRTRSMYHLYE
jgi:hypothetical protein